jgi:hypothetical protein
MNRPDASSSRRWWALVILAGGILVVLARTPALLRVLGVNHYPLWFLDLTAILASNDAQALGLDPYKPNPLDVFGRPHGYSHWWLTLGRAGLTRADVPWLGLTLVGAFFVAAVAQLRPRAWSEVGWSVLVLCAPPMLLALDRANNDLVMFVLLAPVVPCLLSERAWVRLCSVPLLVVAVALKAYPVVALPILLAGATPRDTRRLLLAAALLLLVLLPDTARDFVKYAGIVPETEGLMTMGSRNLFVGLGVPLNLARLLGPLCGALLVGLCWRAKIFEQWTIKPEERGAWLSFVLGALLLTGCFFAGASFAYRWVFAIWLAPLLWQLPRDETAPRAVRRCALAAAGLLVFALWADGAVSSILGNLGGESVREQSMKAADMFFYMEQPIIWAFFGCLLAFLTRFARDGMSDLLAAKRSEVRIAQG